MKVKQLFNPLGVPSQSIGGLSTFLDQDNCEVENITKQDNAIRLNMKRASDGGEGTAYLRVREEFKDVETQILNWMSVDSRIVGLTLNELSELDTAIQVHSIDGRMMANLSNA